MPAPDDPGGDPVVVVWFSGNASSVTAKIAIKDGHMYPFPNTQPGEEIKMTCDQDTFGSDEDFAEYAEQLLGAPFTRRTCVETYTNGGW